MYKIEHFSRLAINMGMFAQMLNSANTQAPTQADSDTIRQAHFIYTITEQEARVRILYLQTIGQAAQNGLDKNISQTKAYQAIAEVFDRGPWVSKYPVDTLTESIRHTMQSFDQIEKSKNLIVGSLTRLITEYSDQLDEKTKQAVTAHIQKLLDAKYLTAIELTFLAESYAPDLKTIRTLAREQKGLEEIRQLAM